MQRINFFIEEINFVLKEKTKLRKWISLALQNEQFHLKELNFIFCSDTYLYNINLSYLKHDTYTDIITFDNSNSGKQIEGDIYISIDRIIDNSLSLNTTFENELHRVIIHGVLHLAGYSDKSIKEKENMRSKEDYYLQILEDIGVPRGTVRGNFN